MTLARLGLTLQILSLILLAALLWDSGALRPFYPALRVTGPVLLLLGVTLRLAARRR
ncbi:hypothetical protein [Deinococcus daejeonensis]|uniref:Uncharacterized protein n=1 Tax=Deinococcus daejeonensis TaxID=1007098 RepID=A0ABQ2ITV8_9DEIO|nr:hypothetical protein [Deinococcus daejeonensis]GGN27279.1 hypothetical protein GCM10010842_00110 [Deinococcus daejeonensis]